MHSATRRLLFVALAASTALTAEALASAPRYKMVLSADNAQHGVSCVSFVENPAIQRGWVALSAAVVPQASLLKLSGEDQEQVVTGPALVPGLEILRLDAQGNPYYISFDAATIRAAQLRFAEQGKHTNTNEGHSIALSGNTVFESWIVRDPERDPATTLGYTAEQIPAGTWMLSAKVPDAATWAKVQSGELTGFSIEALFDAEELKLAAATAPKPSMKKPLWARLTAAGRALLGLSEVSLKDGKTFDVAEDGTVSELDAEGNITGPAPDGEYELASGEKLEVKDGKKVETPEANSENQNLASEGTAAALEILKEITAETTPEDAQAIIEKASAALGKAPEQANLSAVKLEAVPLANGKTVNFDSMTRKLTDEAGALLPSGDYKREDGSCFRVNTDQYCYEIPAADYKATEDAKVEAEATKTELAAVKLELAEAQAKLSKEPAAGFVALGGEKVAPANTKAAEPTGRVAVALSRVDELHARKNQE